MAPIKFEEHIKERLEERTLKPSDASWQTLANRLDTEEKHKNKTVYWWIGIAASIAILIAVTLPFFNNDTNTTLPVLVDVEEESTKKEPLKKDIPLDIIKEQNDETIIVEKIVKKKPINQIASNKSQRNTSKDSNIDASVVIAEKPKTFVQEHVKKETLSKQTIQTFEEAKIIDVVAKITKMKNAPSGVSDKEIDSLLEACLLYTSPSPRD